ncbi:DNA-binding response regulator [Anaerocolumna cellulosilytica]|uniref:Stage 0 sporulation protein A homolog n=1 Tax=Anaerocolumna cellulosilytica TaxID=433286 RepID=A0A6S6R838_9FIRM|nr:AraC family transcriptional regulator [Anaerocolumna cellulosilytica]MBB5197952.1 two-component system response regulator YesN [Anaerocolumna cellulosilytica]BCJ95168.1 DNA-binding response regulator [Anaerocolumna cellulosilytica]
MVKLLIVEDEPLVQIGIRSMVNWSDYGIEICDSAKDGIQGLASIEKYSPKIVITDIKMPQMDGLEMMKVCRERSKKLPVFIVLTSYEEFSLLKEAMKYQIVDYLIKIELNKEDLIEAVKKALEMVQEVQNLEYPDIATSIQSNQSFYDKFFIKLLLNLFESEHQKRMQANELNLDFQADCYVVCHNEIVEYSPMWEEEDKNRLLNLYSSTIQMIREMTKKLISCYVVSLDTKHFSVIFSLSKEQEVHHKLLLSKVLSQTYAMVHNYFNVNIRTSFGRPCHSPHHIPEAYQDARQIFALVTDTTPILFYENLSEDTSSNYIFNMSLFRQDIIKAFEEFDTATLTNIFSQISDIFKNQQAYYLQAVDAASNILYLAISHLPNGEETVSAIFSEDPTGYRSLYKQTNVEQIIQWMFKLHKGLCQVLTEHRKNYKNHIVNNVKKYIDSHIEEKLTLTDVSSVFGISPNYLSQLFKKYNDMGFSDYITNNKIAKAKVLMAQGSLKLYEIADKLGFESSFYFSKVFKKVEGCSPRDYLQIKLKY